MNRKWSIRADGYTIQDEQGNIVCRFFNRDEEDYLNYKENSMLIVEAVNNYNKAVSTLKVISAGKGKYSKLATDALKQL